MATYINRPDSLSLLGNLKSFLIGSSSEVSFELQKGGETILSETYYPNSSGQVEIQVKDIIGNYLSTTLPTGNNFSQSSFAADFTAYLDGSNSYSFRVVNAGVRKLATQASYFLLSNWLTWQPQVKRTVWNAPEYMTFYAANSTVAKAKFYLKSGTTKTVNVASFSAGAAYTVNTTPSRLFSLSGESIDDLYGIVDVWVETQSGSRLTYIQRYILEESQGDEHFYLCVNSLGGIDTYIFHGACALAPDISHENAELGDTKVVITEDAERRWEQTTGYASLKETSWIFELISAKSAWAVMDGTAEPIAIDSSSLRVSDRNNLHSCSFSFTLTEGGRCLNISRTSGTLPAIEVPSPSGEIFFLDLRLSDYPDSDLEPTSLLLLQSPFSNTWFKASLGAITDAIIQDVLAAIPPAQSNLPLNLQYGIVESEAPRTYNGSSEVTARIPSRISHLADRTSVPYLGAVGENGLVQLRDFAGNSIYPALRQGSLWGNSWNGGSVSGPLTFTAGATPSETADLEVITLDGQRCLHTRLPFISDADLAVGGPGSSGGSAGGATYLYQLEDVQLEEPAAGQILKYNGTKWVNAADEGGSLVSWTQHQHSGTKIATVTIGGTPTDVYAPSISYSAGTGLQLNGTTFSLKRATSTDIGGVQLADRGNNGIPVYFDADSSAHTINYLAVQTEAGSIILPFLSNDIAFLKQRGGNATLTGGFSNSPNIDRIFDGKPDYAVITPDSQDAEIVLTITLPTDRAYNYGQRLYIDFGANAWHAGSITVECYHRDIAETESESKYKTVESTCNSSFWVGGLIGTVEGYKVTKLVITFTDFTQYGFRICQVGLQHYDSYGAAASYMSRGSDDPVWRTISPATEGLYDLGAEGSRWRNLYAQAANISGMLTVNSLKLAGSKRIWFGDTYYLELDANNQLHTNAVFASDLDVAVGGPGSGSGGSGGSSVAWGAAANGYQYLNVSGYDENTHRVAMYGHSHAFADLTSKPTTLSGFGITDGVSMVTSSGSGNAVTSITASGHTLSITKGLTFLTSHQSIYSLTLQAGAFSGVTYTPNAAGRTVNIPTTLDHLSDGNTRKLSDYVTLATEQNNISGRKSFTGGFGVNEIYQGTSTTNAISIYSTITLWKNTSVNGNLYPYAAGKNLGMAGYGWSTLSLNDGAGAYVSEWGNTTPVLFMDVTTKQLTFYAGGDCVLRAYEESDGTKSPLLINRNGSTITRSVHYYSALRHSFCVNNSTLDDQTWDVLMQVEANGTGGGRKVKFYANLFSGSEDYTVGESGSAFGALYLKTAGVIYGGGTARITLSGTSSYNSANITLNGSTRVYGDLWLSNGSNSGNKLIFGDRSSSSDYCYIQETPDDSLTIKAGSVLPAGIYQNLGNSTNPWQYLYAKRWYPDAANAPGFYVEYSSANQALTVNGNLIVTGDVAVGAYASGTASFPVSVAGTLTPVSSGTFSLGTASLKFNYVYARYIGDSSNYLTSLYSSSVTATTLNATTVNITGILTEPTLTINESIESYLSGDSGTTSSSLNIASLYSNISNIVNGKYRKLAIGAYTLQVTGYRNHNGQYSVYAGRYWFEQTSAASNYWYIHRL